MGMFRSWTDGRRQRKMETNHGFTGFVNIAQSKNQNKFC